jgi:TetR/AcrR family transcriptional repressor of nem operon
MRTPHADQLRRGESTRERLLDLAESAILEKGYAATSIEELIAAAGITKSGFFYHFREKSELAKALMRRDNANTAQAFDAIFGQADADNADPLDALLDGLSRFAKAAAVSPHAYPGCLIAAFAYQQALFDAEHWQLMEEGFAERRAQFRKRLDRIAAQRPLRAQIDLDDLADMAIAIIQGAIVLDRVRGAQVAIDQQITLYRAFLVNLFE